MTSAVLYSRHIIANDCAIRIKGHRIGIEHVLRDYLNGARADEILRRYPTLTRDEVQLTIGCYLANRNEVDGIFVE